MRMPRRKSDGRYYSCVTGGLSDNRWRRAVVGALWQLNNPAAVLYVINEKDAQRMGGLKSVAMELTRVDKIQWTIPFP